MVEIRMEIPATSSVSSSYTEQNATLQQVPVIVAMLGLGRMDGVSIRSISSCPMTRSFWKASLLPSNCTASASEGRPNRFGFKSWETNTNKTAISF